jgi:putative oxidoreductase
MSSPRTLGVWRSAVSALQAGAPLLMRLVAGQAIYEAGVGQWRHLDNAAAILRGAGIPYAEVVVVLVSAIEQVGGPCLALGLLTQPIALILAGIMAFALLVVDRPLLAEALLPGGGFGPLALPSFVLLLLLLSLAAHGGGLLAIDTLHRRIAQRLSARADRRQQLSTTRR